MSFLGTTFSSLRNRNFRYFWIGQCLSVMGTWIQRTAQTWLVYQMTKSALLVGVLSASQFVPILLLTLVAGTLIDQIPKRKILLFTQFGFLVLGSIMTLIVYLKIVQYWEILTIAIGYGILQSFDTPARQSFVVELVGQKDLMNGISLNSTIFNLAKIVGPSLAGILMVQYGVAFCFLVDTISYIAILIGLFFIRQAHPLATRSHQRVWTDVKDGLSYVWNTFDVKFSAELMLIISTLSFNNNVILPVFAKTVLHSGAQAYAGLMTASGIGSLVAAFLMSYLSRFGLQRRIYLVVGVGSALLQSVMIFVHTFSIAAFVMILIGFCNMIFLNQSNASFQYGVPSELRGRVMSVYVLLNQGTTPIGSMYAGGIMDFTSGAWGFPGCGLLALVLLIPVLIINQNHVKSWINPVKE